MHPEADGHLFRRVRSRQTHVAQVRHERFAGLEDFIGLGVHIHHQPHIAAEFVGEDVKGCLEDPRDGGGRATFGSEPGDLRAESVKVREHGHGTFDEREVITVGGRLADFADLRGSAGKPHVVKEGSWVIDEGVVFVGVHEGVVFGGLDVIETGGVWNAEARNAVVAQPDRLRETGPDIDHIRHYGLPAKVLSGLDSSLEGLLVIVGDLLTGVTRVLGSELGYKRPKRDHVRLLVAHGGDVAVEAFLVE